MAGVVAEDSVIGGAACDDAGMPVIVAELERPVTARSDHAPQLIHGTTHVVLPAYNEEVSLPPLLDRLASLAAEWDHPLRVHVVDDGSSDATADIARQDHPGLEVELLAHPSNRGLGQTVHTGIRAVLADASDDDIVVVMDADDTHDVGLIPLMEQRLAQGADIAIASRFVEGGSDVTAPPFRRALSRAAAVLFRVALPLNGIHDFTSGYRAYRVSLLRRAGNHYGERLIVEPGFACMVELLLKLRHYDPTIDEVAMVLRYDRKGGSSKLRLFPTIRQYMKLLLRDRLSPPPYPGP